MRTYLLGLVLAFIATSAFAETKDITVKAGGAEALKLSVPTDAEVATKGDKTTIQTKTLRIYLWPVAKAKKVEDVLPHVGDIIKSEFTDFVVGGTDTITVAGAEAKHLKGKGAEADDGDPGTADVVIFTTGKHVFVASVHGEKEEAAKERPDFLTVLKSAKAL